MNNENKYVCKICGKLYKSRVQLVRHLNSKHEDKKYEFKIKKCANPKCNNNLVIYSWYNMEDIILTGDIDKKYCSISCLKQYNPRQKYEQNCTCPICNKHFSNSKFLNRHLNKCKERICPLCNNKFYDAKSYYNHIKECDSKQNKCNFCGATFDSEKGLINHLSHCHKDKRIKKYYKCENPECNNLIEYYSIDFYDESHRKTCCQECNNKLTSIISKKRGLIEREYKCPACKYSFHTENELNEHFKKIHIKSNRSFICNCCFATFATKSQLHAHYYKFHKENIKNIKKKCDNYECNNLVNKVVINDYIINQQRYCCRKCSSKINGGKAIKFWRSEKGYKAKYELTKRYNGCKWFNYVDSDNVSHRCQGTYELAFAKRLNELNIKFITHPKGIKYINNGIETYYFPDFYIPSKNLYVDTKAKYYLKLSSDKFIQFRNQNPEINLLILTEKLLKCYGINNIYKYIEDLIDK